MSDWCPCLAALHQPVDQSHQLYQVISGYIWLYLDMSVYTSKTVLISRYIHVYLICDWGSGLAPLHQPVD